MKLSQICQGICHCPEMGEDADVLGLSADSREIKPGYIFAALKGENFDGTQFIPSALEKGAIGILCDEDTKTSADIPLLPHDNPRLALALMARRFYPEQPDILMAVTGTNGKSSVVSFMRQIWSHLGLNAASLGTIGIEMAEGHTPLSHTTPDPVGVSKILSELSARHIDHVAFEASSHGLAQYRLHGLKVTAGGFTNISRDHLDYHKTFEDYFAQKMRLFEEVLEPGSVAVISADHACSQEVMDRANAYGLVVLSVGEKGEALRLLNNDVRDQVQNLTIQCEGERYDICLPLAGSFQVENALVAAGLVIAGGASPSQVLPMLERLQGAKGRLEKIGLSTTGAPIFVDYAHTPDALENALSALRPITKNKLVTIFGCGGDRDKGKRPLMGRVAEKNSDRVIVTDDNPRSENPDQIRTEIMSGCPSAENIGDRREAISHGIASLEQGDILLIAGKGHETGQIIGDKILPFSDTDVVLELLDSV